MKLPHAAFYVTHEDDKEWLLQHLTSDYLRDLDPHSSTRSGELFSNIRLQNFIAEEILHEHFEMTAGVNNTLTFSSSGEQKKALLDFIIAKKPGYLVIDALFDNLDQQTRQSIAALLNELAVNTIILQVFSRQNELLPFIELVYDVAGHELGTPSNSADFIAAAGARQHGSIQTAIPPPLSQYKLPPGPLISLRNVSVSYNERRILNNISWDINAGDFWQLTGPNGSGKSTLLSLITANNPKAYGQHIVLFGHRKGTGESVWDIKKNIGYFSPAMTLQFERQDSIEQMITSGFFDSVGLYLKPSDRQVQIAREWMKVIGEQGDKRIPFRLCPEGNQRMVLIARAMVKHPPLLILDEPTAGLDDEMAALFVSLINKISSETRTAILYVSHRHEPGLAPRQRFNLFPTTDGSVGQAAT